MFWGFSLWGMRDQKNWWDSVVFMMAVVRGRRHSWSTHSHSPASREAMVVKEPVGSFPHDNRRKAPPPSTAQHGNVDTRVYLPDVRGGGVASYVQAGFASHDQLSASLVPMDNTRSSLMASAWARRQVSPSSRDSLAHASLMASVLARRRVSPSSRDSLARASLMASALARCRVSLSSGDSLTRARSEWVVLDRKS